MRNDGFGYDEIFRIICDKDGKIKKTDILCILLKSGLEQSNPRLSKIINDLNLIYDVDYLDFDSFRKIFQDNLPILIDCTENNFVIKDFSSFKDKIETIFYRVNRKNSGRVAQYIPKLAMTNSDIFELAFCSIDGQVFHIGSYQEKLCLQSVCKPINYAIALELYGKKYVHKHVGHEPSGAVFNEIKLNTNGLPHNPMINSGAITICSLIKSEFNLHHRFNYIFDKWKELSSTSAIDVGFDNIVYESEKRTANRNYALAYFMKELGVFPDNTNLEEILDFYFQSCSIEISTLALAKVAAVFANRGVCPINKNGIFSSSTVKNCLSIMYSCGMYNFSGEYAFTIGLPAKSGVSGITMIVIPGLGGFAIFSPKLDKLHNSVKGIEFSKELIRQFKFHQYDHATIPSSKDYYTILDRLFWAAFNGHIIELKTILSKGEVDINSVNYDNRTALHIASSNNQVKIVQYLIISGASPNIKDRWGNRALEEAIGCNNTEIVSMLKKITQ